MIDEGNLGESTDTFLQQKRIAEEKRKAKETRASALGSRDQENTDILRKYVLPGQEDLRRNPRTLLDEKEYLVRLENQDELVRQIQEARKKTVEILRQHGSPDIEEEDVSWIVGGYDAVLGNPSYPETVYRYAIENAKIDKDRQLVLNVQANLEHEKSEGPARLKLSDLTQEQMIATEHPNLGIGARTGRLIAHQRRPVGITIFDADQVDIVIDKPENLWVVVKENEKT